MALSDTNEEMGIKTETHARNAPPCCTRFGGILAAPKVLDVASGKIKTISWPTTFTRIQY
jgi:hypothetical protein